MERWRVAIAIVAALAALPLLAIDNVSSADPERPELVAAGDPAVALLASRATAWGAAHEEQRQEALNVAIAVGVQVEAAEAAEAARVAEEQRAADQAEQRAEAARKAEAARATETDKRPTSARKTTLPPVVPTTMPPPREGDPTADQWAALRQCEASGNYGAVSSGGRFRGAYQFDRATWDLIARESFPHLVGADAAAASPGDQDAVALALYRIRGASPWPRCGAALR